VTIAVDLTVVTIEGLAYDSHGAIWGGGVSTEELTQAYQAGRLGRRRFIRSLIGAGVTAAAATAYADLLAPRGAGAALLAQTSFYDTTTSSSTTTSSTTSTTSSTTSTTTPTSTSSTTSTSSSTTSTTAATTQGTGAVANPEVAPGGTTTFSGGGFAASRALALEIQSDPVSLGTTVSDGAGNFRVTVRIPSSIPPGPHRLVARGPGANGGTREVFAAVTVSGVLARTGSDAKRLGLLGVATVALGRAVAGLRHLINADD
jgi:hypothetical protein